jgi:predicted transcriptional regulator
MKRCKEEIIESILEICKEPSGKTKIVYKANLNFDNTTRYIDQLIDAGHLEASGPTQTVYKTTQKGLEFLEVLKASNAMIRQNNNRS